MMLPFLFLLGCPEPHLKTGVQDRVGTEGLKTCGMAFSYSSVQPIFKSRCLRCHQAGTKNSVAFYSDVLRIQKDIFSDVADGSMPKEGFLPTQEKEFLLKWLDRGAPEKSNEIFQCGNDVDSATKDSPTPTPTPEATPLPAPTPTGIFVPRSYNELREKILVPKCLDCHNGDGDAFLYDFTKYKYMMMLTDIFDTADPRNSQIVKSVLKVGKGQMPSVRSKIPRLTPEEVLYIIEWIEQGMPENSTEQKPDSRK